jgi:3-hydroxyisobutyrate dehydrogenase/2-hydroxy-3-oxopropionate reductase
MKVGVIGLGRMGIPIAQRLLGDGHEVLVHTRSPRILAEIGLAGARLCTLSSEVATRADVVITLLPTEDSVRQVYGELAGVARDGQFFVDCSTVSPGLNRWCAEQVARLGARFLDAPVSGGPAGAREGTLTVMVGGEAEAYDFVLPVLRAFGKNIRLCGGVGAGQAIKLVNQLLVGIHTAAIAEAVALGTRLGADLGVIQELVGASFGGSTMMLRNVPRFSARDFTPATPIGLILKDLGIIHAEAKRTSTPIPLGCLAEQEFVAAGARGWVDEDMAALIKLWD